jgi:putative salt-induced outer membrane protein YdiY
MGYQFLETTYLNLLGKGTVNYVDEQFGTGIKRTRPAFLWNLDFAWKFNDKGIEFFHRHAVLQSFKSEGDYEINSLTGLKYPINGHFSSVVQLQLDYDNSPAAENIAKEDRQWSIGVDYNW